MQSIRNLVLKTMKKEKEKDPNGPSEIITHENYVRFFVVCKGKTSKKLILSIFGHGKASQDFRF